MTDTITTDPLPAVDLRGRKLGELVVGDCIGKGGFGALYLADQPLLGRQAVVKVLHERLRANNEALERFMREARLASRLDHPYAAHIYAFGVEADDGLAWIAMEHVHGTTLAHWLRVRGRLPLAELVPFLECVAEVVQTAHDSGIVHRDLKPSNVMVIERAGKWLPKLLDFGIAKLLTDAAQPETPPSDDPLAATQPALTQANATLGSPPYMSPEQFVDPLTVGRSADVYSLGVMAYELLAGHRPFEANDTAALGDMHRHAPVPPLGMSPAIDRVFQRVLAKDPKDRPVSVLAFVTELERAARPSHRRAAVIAGIAIAGAVAAASIYGLRSDDDAAPMIPLPTASTTSPPPSATAPTLLVAPAVVPTVLPAEPTPPPILPPPAARTHHPSKRPPPPPPPASAPEDIGAKRL
jgi:serine/threonine-protein kinase